MSAASSNRREIHEVGRTRSDYTAVLLTYYENICQFIDRWINVSCSTASIVVSANMILVGIMLKISLESYMIMALSALCISMIICWSLLWYRAFMFVQMHMDQLAAIEKHFCETLGVPDDLCPNLTNAHILRSKFGLRNRLIRIRYVVGSICSLLILMWLLVLLWLFSGGV